MSSGQGPGARVGRGAGAAFVIKVAGTGLVFANQLILARVLGVHPYGQYIYTITWVNLLAVLGMQGADMAAVRFLGEYTKLGQRELLRGFLGYGVRRVLVAACIFGLALGMAVSVFRRHLDPALAIALAMGAFLLPTQAALQYASAVARGFQRIVLAQFPPEVLRPLLFGGGFLTVYLMGHVPPSAAATVGWNVAVTAAVTAAIALALGSSLRVVRGVDPRQDRTSWRAMAFPVLLISGFNVALSQTDTVMVGLLRDTTDAGVYALAARLASLVSFMLVSAGAVAAPMVATYHSSGERHRLQRLLQVATLIVALYAIPASALLIVGGRWALGWFGEPFVGGYLALVILVVGQLVNSLCGPVGIILVMTGHQRLVARILGSAAISNVVLTTGLIQMAGLVGAAIATAVTMIVWNIWMLTAMKRKLGLRTGFL